MMRHATWIVAFALMSWLSFQSPESLADASHPASPVATSSPTPTVSPSGTTPTAPKEENVSRAEATDIDAQGQTSAIQTQDSGKPESAEPTTAAGETGIL